jgi:ribosomal protein S18 acetylase RimI-like enzyme
VPSRPARARRTPPLEIREADAADLPALARLGARLAREHHAMDPARFFAPEEPLEDGYAWWLGKERANPRAVVLAAARRGRIVGYAYGRIEPRDWNLLRDRCGVGVDIWVEPRARRAGVGSALLEALVAALAGRGAPRVVIHVAARNARAARLFGARGFRETMVELTRETAPAPAPDGPRTGRPRSRTRPSRIDRRQSKNQ